MDKLATIGIAVAFAVVAFAGPASGVIDDRQETVVQDETYTGPSNGAGYAFCNTVEGVNLGSVCIPSGVEGEVKITVDDDVSNGNVWISARDSTAGSSVGGCGEVTIDHNGSDTIYVWIWGASSSALNSCGDVGGTTGTVSAEFLG